MNAIDIQNLSFCYRENDKAYLALEDINLSVAKGEFVCLVGHSGCGKSTLLSLIAGLRQPDLGTVMIDGAHVTGPSVDRAMVFQSYSLFPWMTVTRNVAFRIKHARKGLTRTEIQKAVQQNLERVGMEHAANRYPFQLSGGMRQRVALACALAQKSSLLLLDEPFGALDARNRTELQQLLIQLWQNSDHKLTVVFVTHDLDEALLLADRVVFMRPRHIERIVPVTLKRPRTAQDLAKNVEYRQIRNDLLHLFYLDAEEDEQSAYNELQSVCHD